MLRGCPQSAVAVPALPRAGDSSGGDGAVAVARAPAAAADGAKLLTNRRGLVKLNTRLKNALAGEKRARGMYELFVRQGTRRTQWLRRRRAEALCGQTAAVLRRERRTRERAHAPSARNSIPAAGTASRRSCASSPLSQSCGARGPSSSRGRHSTPTFRRSPTSSGCWAPVVAARCALRSSSCPSCTARCAPTLRCSACASATSTRCTRRRVWRALPRIDSIPHAPPRSSPGSLRRLLSPLQRHVCLPPRPTAMLQLPQASPREGPRRSVPAAPAGTHDLLLSDDFWRDGPR